MSTVKISQLAPLLTLSSNTANTIIPVVDLTTGITNKINLTTLSRGLYAFNQLNVGNTSIILPNTIAQFAGSSSLYNQINLQNLNGLGSADYVVTANNGTDSTYYIDMGINGSLYSNPQYSATSNNDGYLYVEGSAATPSVGNLVIGTASAGANVVFVTGGLTTSNIRAFITDTGIVLRAPARLRFGDGTFQNTAASPIAYTQAAFDAANTAASNLSSNNTLRVGISLTQNLAIAYANTTANNALANTVILQGINLTQNLAIAYANTTANNAQANTVILRNINNTQNLAIQSAFDRANISLANTTGVFGGDLTVAGNTIILGTSQVNQLLNPQKGIIYPPTIFPGSQTAITIDFANNALVRCNMSSGLVVSFTNLTFGKTVELWVTNTSGSTQATTHGCSALNSTVGSLNHSIPGTTSACYRYVCFGTDTANTFVSIIQG